jgi:uncharacterized membrane protein YeaQ/YmgE (transglycosylase-associated protein family)
MSFPTLLFALLIAFLCGALFNIFRNGNGWRLFYYLVLSLLGFAVGQWVHVSQGWILFVFGMLDIGLGVVGSIVFLILGEWLSRIEVKNESSV